MLNRKEKALSNKPWEKKRLSIGKKRKKLMKTKGNKGKLIKEISEAD
jgi:hypothetical protein